MYVQVKEVTDAVTFDDNSYTWNAKPATGSTVLDQCAVSASQVNNYAAWNITELAKEHYEGGNTADGVLAFCLEAYGTMENLKCANAALRLTNTSAKPVLQVFYRDTRGIESYLRCYSKIVTQIVIKMIYFNKESEGVTNVKTAKF